MMSQVFFVKEIKNASFRFQNGNLFIEADLVDFGTQEEQDGIRTMLSERDPSDVMKVHFKPIF